MRLSPPRAAARRGDASISCARVRLGTAIEVAVWAGDDGTRLPLLEHGGELYLPAGLALTMVLRLFDRWQLTITEQAAVLAVSPATVRRYRRGQRPGRIQTCDRLGTLLQIHALLTMLYPAHELRYTWVRRRNNHFGGRRPLDVMMTDGLEPVHHHLIARCLS